MYIRLINKSLAQSSKPFSWKEVTFVLNLEGDYFSQACWSFFPSDLFYANTLVEMLKYCSDYLINLKPVIFYLCVYNKNSKEKSSFNL